MTLTVDKAGRVVLPKSIRDRLGLRPGAELNVHVEPDGEVRLRARQEVPALAVVKGVLVHFGRPVAEIDWASVVDAGRDERFRSLADGML